MRGLALLIAVLLLPLVSGCGEGQDDLRHGRDAQALGTPLGDGWYGIDLGNSKNIGGASTLSGGVFTVSGGGGDLWGYQDDAHLAFKPVTGDFDLVARVTGYSGDTSGDWAKAAIVFKEDTGDGKPTAGAAGVYQSLNYATDDFWYVRDAGGYISSFSSSTINGTGQGALIRMTRVGNTFRSFHFDNGSGSWVQHGGDRVLSLNTLGYVGMAAASNTGSLMTVTFEDVSLTVPAPDTTPPVIANLAIDADGTSATISWTTDEPSSSLVHYGTTTAYGLSQSAPGSSTYHQVVLTGLTVSTQYHFSVVSEDASSNAATSADAAFNSGIVGSTALPSAWTGINLGGSQAAGGTSIYSNGSFTLSGGGGNLWDYQDDGHFVYQPIQGDFDLIAQVDAFSGDTSYTHAKAALMFKEDTGTGVPTASAQGVYQGLSCNSDDYWYVRGNGYISQYSTANLNTVGGGARLRLTRTGDVFRSYHWDSVTKTWVQHGIDRTVPLSSSGFVGLAATSGTFNLMNVKFSGVSLTDGSTPPDTAAPSIDNLAVTVTDTTAHVTWTTDEPASTALDHGPSDSYGSHHETEMLVTSHGVLITGLQPGTDYHFQVQSTDMFDNASSSMDTVFTTTGVPAPVEVIISDITVTNVDEHSADVSWTTNIPTATLVDYDLNGSAKQVGDTALSTTHAVTLDRMMSGEAHDFVITADNGLGNSATSDVQTLTTTSYTAGALPLGWGDLDVGVINPDLAGSAIYDPNHDGGSFSVRGTGFDVFNTEDRFHFVFQPVDGDFVLTFRVDGYHGHLHKWTKALAMFRVDLDDDSQMFTQSLNNNDNDWLYYRDTKGAQHTEIDNNQLNPGAGAPVWARLSRSGNSFTFEYSADGVSWLEHGATGGTVVNLPSAGFVGFGVASRSDTKQSEIVFTDVSLTTSGAADVTPPVIADVLVDPIGTSATISWTTDELSTGVVSFGATSSYGSSQSTARLGYSHSVQVDNLTPETLVHFSIAASDLFANTANTADDSFDSDKVPTYELPPGWASVDLGASSGGQALQHNGVFTVTGGGGDLWGSQDDGHFVYQPVTGDFELIVQVDGYAGNVSDIYAKAALMFKADTGTGVPEATGSGIYQSLNRNTDDYWYERNGTDIPSYSYTSLEVAGGGALLRLTREGNTFRSYHWDAGSQQWVQHGADRTVSLNSDGYAGFAVSGTGPLTVTFSGVSLGALVPPETPPEPPPSSALPAGWFNTDLHPGFTGDAVFLNDQFVISGAGGDFWNSSDGGHIVYQPVTGDFTLQATLVSYAGNTSAAYAKAVLLFKEAGAGASEPTADGAGVFQSINHGAEDYWYQRDQSGGGISSYSSSNLNTVGGSVRVSLTREGNTFRSWRWDEVAESWIQIGADRVVALGTAGYVGMGVTSTNAGLMDVTFGDVSLTTP